MSGESGSADVFVRVGESEPQIEALTIDGETSVTVVFVLDGSTVTVAFGAEEFHSFADQIRRFAETTSGRPS